MTFADPSANPTTELFGTQLLTGVQLGNGQERSETNVDTHLLLKNTSDAQITISGALSVETPGGSVAVLIPARRIDADKLIDVPISELRQSRETRDTAVSLRLSHDGAPGSLVGRAYGLLDRKTFGFYWALVSRPI